MKVDWQQLFLAYAAAAAGGDAQATAAFYAPCFIAAGPKGTACFPNDEQFLAWLRQVYAFNEKSGMEALSVVSVAASPLGEHFAAVMDRRAWPAVPTFHRLHSARRNEPGG